MIDDYDSQADREWTYQESREEMRENESLSRIERERCEEFIERDPLAE